MIIFIDEDDGYLQWIDSRQRGYVVNAARRPKPSYLVLHRTTCPHISTASRSNWTKQYIKVCAEDPTQLRDWAKLVVGGDLQECSFCKPSDEIRHSSTLSYSSDRAKAIENNLERWTLWHARKTLVAIDDLQPLKASWEKSSDPSQIRLRAYRQDVRNRLRNVLNHDRLFLNLRVGLAETSDLLIGNDLDNYLTPLFECACLPAAQFRLVMAEKTISSRSQLEIGIAEPLEVFDDEESFHQFEICPTVKPTNDNAWKSEIQDAIIASSLSPLAEGEVELHIAWRCALGRGSWFRFWKSTGDSMGPILGQYQRKNRFDPKDDRITKLVLYLMPDESMAGNVAVHMWWRIRDIKAS